MEFSSAGDDGHQVFLAHHEELLAVELDLGAGILSEEHLVADLDVEGTGLAVLENLAPAHGQYFAPDGLLGGRIGDDDPARRGSLLLGALHDDAIVQWTQLHG